MQSFCFVCVFSFVRLLYQLNPGHWLTESLASLGIMGEQLRVPLKHLNTIECCDIRTVSSQLLP